MRKLLLFLGIIAITALFAGCGSDEPLTSATAMNKFKELSPREGAEFYMQNREEYTFLDTLYKDSVMPAVLQCNFFDLDSVRDVLKGTSFKSSIDPVYSGKREEVIQKVNYELGANTKKQMEIYRKYYLPCLEMSIDSMLDEDVDKVMSKYAGGFLNFRKLAFLFGRGRNDFKEIFWENFDTLRYMGKMEEYVRTFYNTVQEEQNAYCKDLTGKSFDHNIPIYVPRFYIGLSRSTLSYVKKYTKQQTEEMVTEAIKDYAVPLVADLASGGLGTVYDIGNTAYDVNNLVKEVKEAKIDDDEMVKYICSHDLSYQIRNFYIDKWTQQVDYELRKSNEELFKYIQKNL